jgi:hypothetical protein
VVTAHVYRVVSAYGLRPYRYPRMRRQSVMLRAPQSFLDKVLWPEFLEINAASPSISPAITDTVILRCGDVPWAARITR